MASFTSLQLLRCFTQSRLNLSLTRKLNRSHVNTVHAFVYNRASFHSSITTRGMEEFFDVPKNWGKKEVKVGRAWRIGELRIKSNEDLHKLWYVLLKEQNMLLALEYACKQDHHVFPNPERLDKVSDSMKNIEAVVRERNKAYMLLETGETGERPGGKVKDIYGRFEYKEFQECHVPEELNPVYEKYHYIPHPELDRLNLLLNEKNARLKQYLKNEKRRYLMRLFRKFPDMDVEMLKERYPDIDIEEIRDSPKSAGHHDRNRG
ncbi:Ribosomal protein L47 mitochondrial [Trinorchestia longiramus]|nr:Ribosomal protein L47 mitochondrial [Trinorchestia longiramus]